MRDIIVWAITALGLIYCLFLWNIIKTKTKALPRFIITLVIFVPSLLYLIWLLFFGNPDYFGTVMIVVILITARMYYKQQLIDDYHKSNFP